MVSVWVLNAHNPHWASGKVKLPVHVDREFLVRSMFLGGLNTVELECPVGELSTGLSKRY
jgi:hypothetical protein